MEVRILDAYTPIDYETERGMIIPCSPYGLAIKKSDNMETGKCPICGKRIYMAPDGCMGHEVDDEYKLKIKDLDEVLRYEINPFIKRQLHTNAICEVCRIL